MKSHAKNRAFKEALERVNRRSSSAQIALALLVNAIAPLQAVVREIDDGSCPELESRLREVEEGLAHLEAFSRSAAYALPPEVRGDVEFCENLISELRGVDA